MRSLIIAGLLFFFLLTHVPFLHAFPNKERANLNLVSSKATSFILQDDRFVFVSIGDKITRIDTQTWAVTADQVPALLDNTATHGTNLTGNVAGLTVRGSTLFASQTDGDLLTIDLNAMTGTPRTTNIITGALGSLVADTETGSDDDRLYILDKANSRVVVFDVSSNAVVTSVPLVDGLGAAVSPVAIVFVPFPTTDSSSTTDKIFVTSNRGLVFVMEEGASSVSGTITLSATNKDLPAAAVTPDGNFLLVVNKTDTTVHVIDTATNLEVDADPVTAGTNPISLPKNGSLEGIAIADVTTPTDTYAFVTGTAGISVIDLNTGVGSVFSKPVVIDFNDKGSSDTDDDPLTVTSTPGPVLASSTDQGFVLTSNGNATISVISDNPFVTISSTSLGSGKLAVGGTFTLTFQSDIAGSYSVRVGGNLTRNGTEVATGTVGTADTDVSTGSISFDSGIFGEGTNRIFVFVTDADGNVGHDAVDVEVDTPPSAIEITSANFGDEKVYVTFNRLTVSDIDHYNVIVDTDSTVIGTKTTVAATASQPSSGKDLTVKATGLINGLTYFIGVEGVDKSGNVGVRATALTSGAAASATPEKTVGLAGITGEAGGCSLVRGDRR